MLPFQSIAGRYKFRIGAIEEEPVVDLVLVVHDYRILTDHTTRYSADAPLAVTNCGQGQVACLSKTIVSFVECPQTSTLMRARRQSR